MMGQPFGGKPRSERLTINYRLRSQLPGDQNTPRHKIPTYPSFWAVIALLLPLLVLSGIETARAVKPAQNTGLFLPLVSHPPVASFGYAAWSSPIALSARDGSLWVVNPDAGSLSVINAEEMQKRGELYIGGEPWSLAISHDGSSIFVTDRAQGRLLLVDSATLTLTKTLFVGNEPGGLVLSADGRRLYVSLMAEAAIVAIDSASFEIVDRVAVASAPYALAVASPTSPGKEERLFVTHLFGFPIADTIEAEDNSREGRITVIDIGADPVTDLGQMLKVEELILPPNEHGMASLMASIALQAGRAWIPHVRASPSLPNDLTSTVFAAVSTLDLRENVEIPDAALHLNDQKVFGSPVNNPAAVAPSPDGRMLYLVHGGSDLLEIVDISTAAAPRLVKFLPTGKNPRGIVISADGSHAFVMNYLARSVSAYDLDNLVLLAEISVTGETLPPDLLAGKILFHNATDPRLSRGGWVSCASCHFDGWPDGVTWIFPDGPRQSPMLWNAAQTLPWHWSAALDEAQDVEETIHLIQHGLGLAQSKGASKLGSPLTGESSDLDNLATFLLQGIRPANVSVSQGDTFENDAPKSDAMEIAAGRALFSSQGCNGCHGGATWTISALPGLPGTLDSDGDGMINSVLHGVGTASERDLRGQEGFDVPSLLGVGLTAPYFHDGSTLSLEELLRAGHPAQQGQLPALDAAQITELIRFLRSIGPETEPIIEP